MYLLTTDLHLTDRPEDEYRWAVLDEIQAVIPRYGITGVFILGDTWDRRDRHGAGLVNRTVTVLRAIAALAPVTILRGNHDTTLRNPAYWEFLNHLAEPITYVTEPLVDPGGLGLLPFTPRPKQDWTGIRFRELAAAFMHATVPGAITENGVVMENPDFPLLPRSCQVYSGDVHVPQQIGGVRYVGAPHHIRFGDNYPCRMLVLNPGFAVAHEIIRQPPSKWMLDIHDIAELDHITVARGDQVKIRLHGTAAELDRLAGVEPAVLAWAQRTGATVAATEVQVTGTHRPGGDPSGDPAAILRGFAASEGLSADIATIGLELLREALDNDE